MNEFRSCGMRCYSVGVGLHYFVKIRNFKKIASNFKKIASDLNSIQIKLSCVLIWSYLTTNFNMCKNT